MTSPISLYRSLLRTALRLPDQHRVNLVVWRVRTEFDKSRGLIDEEEIAERMMEGEVYGDNLEHQLRHLSSLSSKSLLIPLDIRSADSECTNPNHSHSHQQLDRRKMVEAVKARERQREGMELSKGRRNRFMMGPEPSWVKGKGEAD